MTEEDYAAAVAIIKARTVAYKVITSVEDEIQEIVEIVKKRALADSVLAFINAARDVVAKADVVFDGDTKE